ncbi:MAG: hypothetical protein HUU20_03485 [Pirellulales bacterium]|nr:hypothetical protein [Pirellulales bacterium]
MQLFDLASDPGEQRNMAADHPDEVCRLKAAFDAVNQHVPVVEEVRRVKKLWNDRVYRGRAGDPS